MEPGAGHFKRLGECDDRALSDFIAHQHTHGIKLLPLTIEP